MHQHATCSVILLFISVNPSSVVEQKNMVAKYVSITLGRTARVIGVAFRTPHPLLVVANKLGS